MLTTLLIIGSCAFASNPEDLRAAAGKSVALMQKVNSQWKSPCISCHNQTLGDLALESARQHGIAVDEKLAHAANLRTYKPLLNLDEAVRVEFLIDPAFAEGSVLVGAAAAGVRPSLVTSTYARHIARNQQPDGSWSAFDYRPPSSHSIETATAVAARAIATYLPAQLAKEKKQRLARAQRWLAAAKPQDTESASFRLLGLVWTKAPPELIGYAAVALAQLQRADGAWSQTPTSPGPDAYSTSQALYALRLSQQWKADRNEFLLGIDWLLKQQKADGSWHVKSRILTPAPISPPFFESGFPHGKDQYISMAATAWAVRALASALPVVAKPAAPLALPDFDASKLSWAEAALFGQLGDLEHIDANAATAGGTTALMMAADQPEKIKVLLKRGAKVNAVTAVGYDALLMAALYGGNAESLALLLDAGIPVEPSRKVRFDATALALSLITNDSAMTQLLLARKADANRGYRLLGGPPVVPLFSATAMNNRENIRALVKAGAKLENADGTGMTVLSWAALSHKADSAAELISLGAKQDVKDKFGLTPIEHTAAISESPASTAALLKKR